MSVGRTRARRTLHTGRPCTTLRQLNGVPVAERFYANLFDLLDTRPDISIVQDPAPRWGHGSAFDVGDTCELRQTPGHLRVPSGPMPARSPRINTDAWPADLHDLTAADSI
jgi:hypothetical protein